VKQSPLIPTCHPPPLPAGLWGFAPDPISKTKQNKPERKIFFLSSSFFLSKTKDKYLIANCEDKGYHLSSHTNPREFSHGKSNGCGGFSIRDYFPFRRPEDLARYAEGLRKAGLAE
jgi:hypothetical protein